MTDTDSQDARRPHDRGHSRIAQLALDDARRCDEYSARRLVAVTRVRALLVELGRATQEGERRPLVSHPAAGVAELREVLAGQLGARDD